MKKNMRELSDLPGTYLLLLHLDADERIEVGRLGELDFRKGWYIYVGSAFGPGGVGARLRRHLRQDKKRHWHIDYLRACASVREVWLCTAPLRLEHRWAERLQEASRSCRPVRAFGSSDCRCPSHLFYFANRPGHATLRRRLGGDLSVVSDL
jgi:Uri superfamily endonuclease